MTSIISAGHFHPENRFDNKFLEDLGIESSAEWIVEKIGILERRTTLPLEYIRETKNADPLMAAKVATMTAADMGVNAAQMALSRAGLSPNDIGMVICNTVTPQHPFRSLAGEIALGLEIANNTLRVMDMVTACPAFALHMHYLEQQRSETLPLYTLCICTGTYTHGVDYNNRSDSAIWGDGAAAWIVARDDSGTLKVLDTFFQSNPLKHFAVQVKRNSYFEQDGRAVRDFSVRRTVKMVKALEVKFPDIDWSRDVFIGHQANRTMLEQIVKNRKIPAENHWHNVTYIGNQAAAGAPASLSQHWDKITEGQKICVAVVGAGLSWGSVLLQA